MVLTGYPFRQNSQKSRIFWHLANSYPHHCPPAGCAKHWRCQSTPSPWYSTPRPPDLAASPPWWPATTGRHSEIGVCRVYVARCCAGLVLLGSPARYLIAATDPAARNTNLVPTFVQLPAN